MVNVFEPKKWWAFDNIRFVCDFVYNQNILMWAALIKRTLQMIRKPLYSNRGALLKLGLKIILVTDLVYI